MHRLCILLEWNSKEKKLSKHMNPGKKFNGDYGYLRKHSYPSVEQRISFSVDFAIMHMFWRCKAGLCFASVSFLDTVCGVTFCHSFFCCIAIVNIIILTKQELTAKFPCPIFCKYTFIIDLEELHLEKSSVYIENFKTVSKDTSSEKKINVKINVQSCAILAPPGGSFHPSYVKLPLEWKQKNTVEKMM